MVIVERIEQGIKFRNIAESVEKKRFIRRKKDTNVNNMKDGY